MKVVDGLTVDDAVNVMQVLSAYAGFALHMHTVHVLARCTAQQPEVHHVALHNA